LPLAPRGRAAQGELISGDRNGNLRVWDLAANTCSCELVPAGEVAIRSVTVAADASLVAAANDHGSVFVWKLGKGADLTTQFEPHHMLQVRARLRPRPRPRFGGFGEGYGRRLSRRPSDHARARPRARDSAA
jgi:hypothetical protein